MFQLIEPSSGQIKNAVLVHSVSAQYGIPYCALTECTGTVFCIWPDDGYDELKHVAELLIMITNMCCVY